MTLLFSYTTTLFDFSSFPRNKQSYHKSHLGLVYSCQTTDRTPIDTCPYYTFRHSFATLFLGVPFLVPRIQYHVFHPSRGCFSCRINTFLVFCCNTVVSIVPKHAVLALDTISPLVHSSNPQFASSLIPCRF